jgi:hypothetical protein
MGLENLIRKFSKTRIGFKILGCCHAYPDAFAIAGLYKNNHFFTEYYCFECNKYFLRKSNDDKITTSFKEKIKKEGRVIYSTIESLEKLRKDALSNYLSK